MRRLHGRLRLLVGIVGLATPWLAEAVTLALQVPAGYPENSPPGSTTFDVVATREAADPPLCVISGEVVTTSGTAFDDVDYIGTFGAFGPLTVDATNTTASQTFNVDMIDDTLLEGDETFDIAIQNELAPNCTVNVVQRNVTATIVDDDQPTGVIDLASFFSSATEGDAVMTVTVTRTGGTAGVATVDYATEVGSGSTATDGQDFTGVTGTLTWVDGQGGAQTFTVPVLDDAALEPTENFDIVIQNATGAGLGNLNRATGEILDNDSTVDPGPALDVDGSPGQTVDVTFDVTGDGAPFTLGAEIGTVTPATLPGPGTATYSFTVPPDAQIGSTVVDSVFVTDAVGFTVTKDIVIQIVDPERALAEIPDLTPNQRALARYLDELCPRLEARGAQTVEEGQLIGVCNGIRDTGTTDDQVRAALDAINPEELIVAATTALRLTFMQNGNLMERINALRSGASGVDLAGLDLQIGGQHIAGAVLDTVFAESIAPLVDGLFGGGASADDFARWGLFANGSIKIGDKDVTTNEAGFEYDSIGVTVGADYRLRDNLVLGVGIGYATVDNDYDRAAGQLDIEAWSASLFGTYFQADSFYVDGMLTWGSNDYDTLRNIQYTDALGTVQARADGETDGVQLSGGLSGGWDFNRGPWTFGPHAGAYYFDVDVDGFRESGGGAFDFAIGDQNAQSFQLNAGAHASVVINTGWGVLIPHARVDFVHDLQDSAEVVTVTLANDPFSADPTDPTPVVQLETDRPDSDYVVWSVGTSAQFVNGVSGFVNYRSMAGFDDFSMHDVTWGLRFEKSF